MANHYTSHSPDPTKKRHFFCRDYEVEALIGQGSFGHVYRCRHVKTKKLYAIKEFKNKYPNQKKAFECREIQILTIMEDYARKKGRACPFIMKAESI